MIGELLLKCCTLKSSKSVKGEAIVQNIGRSYNLQVCNECWEEGGGVCICVGGGSFHCFIVSILSVHVSVHGLRPVAVWGWVQLMYC